MVARQTSLALASLALCRHSASQLNSSSNLFLLVSFACQLKLKVML